MTMSNIGRGAAGISIPNSLLTVQTPLEAAEAHSNAGLKSVLLHAPTPRGGAALAARFTISPRADRAPTGKHPISPGWQKKDPSFDELRDQITRLEIRSEHRYRAR